jgi:hypothetical protein
MEAIPLSDTSTVACAKALTFTWISCFGDPETITSDRGLQFTSNFWFKLCEMLHISHKQTTAHHPESNAAVKRLHRRLKDALSAHAAAATWSEELPFVLLRLRAQPREDTGLSPAEAVFVTLIVLPNEFLQNEEMSVDAIIKIFQKFCMFLLFLCPGTILAPSYRVSCQASCSPPPLSGSDGAALSHPFSRSTTAPTLSCTADPAPSPSELGPGMRLSPSAATEVVPISSTATATEVGPLTSSPPGLGQSLWGVLRTPAYTPGDVQTSWVYSNNPILHLYISCYVTVDKPVLSYLLLRLLPQPVL